ncbi:hypothetical protein FQN50_009346 [Emmonsiellopsis sp. PD_5]|nr:hypothetical protein FQN50_009346 [Emmonsiellopsis sp. PD_5]
MSSQVQGEEEMGDSEEVSGNIICRWEGLSDSTTEDINGGEVLNVEDGKGVDSEMVNVE